MKQLKHEMNNELQTLFQRVFHLLEQETVTEKSKELNLVLQTCRKLKALIQSVDEADQHFQLQETHADLLTLIIDTIQEMRAVAQPKNISIGFQKNLSHEQVSVWCDAQKIREVLVNLIKNSIEAIHKNGSITIELSETLTEWEIVCKDSGPGVTVELREKIFHQSFTTKKKSGGLGLGLAICKKIAELHGGDLSYHPYHAQTIGACFALLLPKHSHIIMNSSDNKKSVVLIDDDQRILQGLQKILDQKYHTLSFASVESAMNSILSLKSSDYHLIVDIGSVGKTLGEFETFFFQLPQSLQKYLILTTGDSPHSDLIHALMEKNIPIIFKPFDVKKLFQIISEQK